METFYLPANVGFSLLKDQSQVFHVVCLKEAFNLCLAGEREQQIKTCKTGSPWTLCTRP